MTPAIVVAVAALRCAQAQCPSLADKAPITLAVEREPRWAHGVRAHFDTATPLTVFVDPEPKRWVA